MFPMLKLLMPWGNWSAAGLESPSDSDDGPIFWVRPGEQVGLWYCSSRKDTKIIFCLD